MSRWTPRPLAVAFVLGTAITLAVAWLCAACSRLSGVLATAQGKTEWRVPVPSSWEAFPEVTLVDRGMGLSLAWQYERAYRSSSPTASGLAGRSLVTLQSGLPWPALISEIAFDANPGRCAGELVCPEGVPSVGFAFGVPLPPDLWPAHAGSQVQRSLPLRPCWSGLLANSALCAALIMSIGYAVVVCSQLLRIRKDKCATCGFLLGRGHGACPECGAPRPRRGVGVKMFALGRIARSRPKSG